MMTSMTNGVRMTMKSSHESREIQSIPSRLIAVIINTKKILIPHAYLSKTKVSVRSYDRLSVA